MQQFQRKKRTCIKIWNFETPLGKSKVSILCAAREHHREKTKFRSVCASCHKSVVIRGGLLIFKFPLWREKFVYKVQTQIFTHMKSSSFWIAAEGPDKVWIQIFRHNRQLSKNNVRSSSYVGWITTNSLHHLIDSNHHKSSSH